MRVELRRGEEKMTDGRYKRKEKKKSKRNNV